MLKKILIGFALVMGIVSCVIPVSASVFTINPGTGNVIQAAINSASSGDTIVLNPGTYSENGIIITGKNLTLRAADGHGPSDTIIDGKSSAPRIFAVTDTSSLTIENLALRNGRAGDGARGSEGHWTSDAGPGGAGGNGGAIFSYGSVTIITTTIIGCSAGNGGNGGDGGWINGDGGNGGPGGNGGAIYSAGTVTIILSAISNCQAGTGGNGGIGGEDGDDASNGAGGNGGAIYSTGNVTLTNSEINGCSAGNGTDGNLAGGNGGNGGAIYSAGNVTLTTSAIIASSAGYGGKGGAGNGGTGGSGGAIFTTGTVTLANASTITDCVAGTGGGIRDCDFSGGAGGSGGAIFSSGLTTITASTISNCSAGNGAIGGADANGGTGGSGGGIYTTGPVTLTSASIIECSAGDGGRVDEADGDPVANGGTGGSGGGIYATGLVTLTSATITECSAGNGGIGNGHEGWAATGNNGGNGGNAGAILSFGGVTGTSSTIDSCSAGNGGAGSPGTWAVDGGTGGIGGNGGAIYAPGGTVALTTVTITDCTAGNGGTSGDDCHGGNGGNAGAIEASVVTLTSSIIESSRAGNGGNGGEDDGNGGNGGSGGAIFADTTTTITSSVISNCSAGSGSPGGSDASSGSGGNGGAVHSFYGPVSVTGSTFNNCVAYNRGGAIFTDYAVTATTSTFTNCRAFYGGAVYGRGGPIHFCRLLNNDKNIFSWLDGTSVYSPGRSFDATNNWWGSNNDPSEQVNSVVSYSPWLVLGITSTPPPLTTQDYTVQANLTYDSDGIWHDPALGHVPDGIPVSYSASLGYGVVSPASAGTTNGLSQTTFTSTKPGTAMVSATVDNQTVSTFIERPIADFTIGDRSVVRQLQAAVFTDQSISTLPISYAWDFGDGTTSAEQNPPPHIYKKEENYTVTLTVSNALGHDTNVDYIFATPPNPLKANFMAENKAGQSPLMVTFTDHSNVSVKIPSYPAIDSWLWDFGDGTNSNQQNPNHLYQNAGRYNVTLTVSNSIDNDSKTKDFIVVVPVKNTGQVPKKVYFKLS